MIRNFIFVLIFLVLVFIVFSCKKGSSTSIVDSGTSSKPASPDIRKTNIRKTNFKPPTDASWNHSWGNLSVDFGFDVTTDNNGNVYTLGVTSRDKYNDLAFVVLKYSPDGKFLWSKGYVTRGKEKELAFTPIGIAYSKSKLVIGTYGFRPSDRKPLVGIMYIDTDGKIEKQNYVLLNIKIDHHNPIHDYEFNNMKIDNNGEAVVSGFISSKNISSLNYDVSDKDWVLIKFSSRNEVKFAKVIGGRGDESQHDLCTDINSNIYLAGSTNSLGNNKYALFLKTDKDGDIKYKYIWTKPDQKMTEQSKYDNAHRNPVQIDDMITQITTDDNLSIYLVAERKIISRYVNGGNYLCVLKISQNSDIPIIEWQVSPSIKLCNKILGISRLSFRTSYSELFTDSSGDCYYLYCDSTGDESGYGMPQSLSYPTIIMKISQEGSMLEQFIRGSEISRRRTTGSHLAENGEFYLIGSSNLAEAEWKILPIVERIDAVKTDGRLITPEMLVDESVVDNKNSYMKNNKSNQFINVNNNPEFTSKNLDFEYVDTNLKMISVSGNLDSLPDNEENFINPQKAYEDIYTTGSRKNWEKAFKQSMQIDISVTKFNPYNLKNPQAYSNMLFEDKLLGLDNKYRQKMELKYSEKLPSQFN